MKSKQYIATTFVISHSVLVLSLLRFCVSANFDAFWRISSAWLASSSIFLFFISWNSFAFFVRLFKLEHYFLVNAVWTSSSSGDMPLALDYSLLFVCTSFQAMVNTDHIASFSFPTSMANFENATFFDVLAYRPHE